MSNGIEELLSEIATLRSGKESLRLEYRAAPSAHWDIRIILGDQTALPALQDLLLRNQLIIAQFEVKGAAVQLRFADDHLSGEVDRMLAGAIDARLGSALRGRRVIVQFLDPNSTKAMHLGHLYEAILGRALATSLSSLGAEVSQYCFVSDISRSVCEAMAGLELFGQQEAVEKNGEKTDHMVGRLYAQYAERYYAEHPEEAANEDPIRRETGIVGDRADEFVQLYQKGDCASRALWRRVRDWVVDGQVATLVRLDVVFDTIQYGSDYDGLIEDFIARGVRQGVLEREASGTVVYHSGKQEYEAVVMTRSDGFPTEHTRQMAQMISVFGTCGDLDRYYTFMGMEWKPAWMVYADILRGIYGSSPYHDIVEPVCHGMVLVQGSKMKSSNGAALLADELLDQVEALPEVLALAELTGHGISAASVRDIVVKSFFLSRRMAKDLNFSWRELVSPADNPGWRIASAWCALHAPPRGGRSGARRLDIERLLLLRRFDLSRALNFAVQEVDLSVAIKFIGRLSDTISGTVVETADERATALARKLLGSGLMALGMSVRAVALSVELRPVHDAI
jgi:arginyl-tRNA synthetase